MIQVKIQEMCERRGINTAYQLQRDAGLAPSLAASLYNHRFSQISLETLDKLCRALKCQPGQLLHYEAEVE
jgi:putative transcriptional regulator